MKFLISVRDFISCLLQENCKWSIKKILVYAFSILVIYVVICTDKEYYELLMFVAALLGIRTYERVKGTAPAPTPSAEDTELLAKPPKKQILTD